jgi:hypothetical protein
MRVMGDVRGGRVFFILLQLWSCSRREHFGRIAELVRLRSHFVHFHRPWVKYLYYFKPFSDLTASTSSSWHSLLFIYVTR